MLRCSNNDENVTKIKSFVMFTAIDGRSGENYRMIFTFPLFAMIII